MNQRKKMKHTPSQAIRILTALLLVPLVSLQAAAESEQSRSAAKTAEGNPNVVVIFADDLGWADLSCYGSTLNAVTEFSHCK